MVHQKSNDAIARKSVLAAMVLGQCVKIPKQKHCARLIKIVFLLGCIQVQVFTF